MKYMNISVLLALLSTSTANAACTTTNSKNTDCEPLTDTNFQTAVDLWDSNPTSATTTYGHIKDWYTKDVTVMANAFQTKTTFNEDISGWDVSSVTDMSSMFEEASSFTGDLCPWPYRLKATRADMFVGSGQPTTELSECTARMAVLEMSMELGGQDPDFADLKSRILSNLDFDEEIEYGTLAGLNYKGAVDVEIVSIEGTPEVVSFNVIIKVEETTADATSNGPRDALDAWVNAAVDILTNTYFTYSFQDNDKVYNPKPNPNWSFQCKGETLCVVSNKSSSFPLGAVIGGSFAGLFVIVAIGCAISSGAIGCAAIGSKCGRKTLDESAPANTEMPKV